MYISGIVRSSLTDYPGEVAAVLFTLGCQFRCGYCHNAEFVLPDSVRRLKPHCISADAVFAFLEQRKGKLTGVVVTGGEPTLMPDLIPFITHIKEMGFLVKLDTNGARPDVLKRVLEDQLVDYVAMDMKTAFADYQNLVGQQGDGGLLRQSAELLMQSSIAHEFRSTLIHEYHSADILAAMREDLAGAKALYLQTFRPAETLDPGFGRYRGFTNEEMKQTKDFFAEKIQKVGVR